MNEKSQQHSWIAIGLWAVTVLLLAYVGGYFAFGTRGVRPSSTVRLAFASEPVALAYIPLGIIEAKLRGTHVVFQYRDEATALHWLTFDP